MSVFVEVTLHIYYLYTSRRWIFNIFHGTLIGFAAELFACKYCMTFFYQFLVYLVVNVGLGIALFEAGGCGTRSASQYTILWVYIAFVAFLLILQFTLFVVFTVSALKSSPESNYINWSVYALFYFIERRQLAPSLIKYFFPSNQRSEKYDIEMTNRNDTKKADDPPAKKPPSEVKFYCLYSQPYCVIFRMLQFVGDLLLFSWLVRLGSWWL